MVSYAVVLGIVAFLIYRHRKKLGGSYQYAKRVSAPLRTFVLPVPQQYRTILQTYFPYYQKLNAKSRSAFELKVSNFIYRKQFIPRQVAEVTIEAKVLIAACAVQLTFGLPHVYLRHFNKIVVYPNNYYSSITKRYHKGEVNPRFGIIVLSWQAFVDGYINQTDSTNVGLHEMAHALRLENLIRSDDSKFFDREDLKTFDEYAQQVCSSESITFFRAYACVNIHEFFAVAVENFFERPVMFKDQLPDLYAVLCRLLKQDPTEMVASRAA